MPMYQVCDVLEALEKIAPARFAFPFDKVGLQVGDESQAVSKAVVCLDHSDVAIQFAIRVGAQMLITHHPLIFDPIEDVTNRNPIGKSVLKMAQHRIAFAAAHTNWDAAKGGINDALAIELGLTNIADFGSAAQITQLKMVATVPGNAMEAVLDAAAKAGAGTIGEYSRCAFANVGIGHFEPGPASNPTIGEVGSRESVEEVRIEMTLPQSARGGVEAAVRSAHPYEEPVLDFYEIQSLSEQPIGRIGQLESAVSLFDFVSHIEAKLGTKCWTWGEGKVSRVAVVGGAADSEWSLAQASGADVLVTGEVKQHVALEANKSGFSITAAGHYATENPGCRYLRDRLRSVLPEVEWLFFQPARGTGGRPLEATKEW